MHFSLFVRRSGSFDDSFSHQLPVPSTTKRCVARFALSASAITVASVAVSAVFTAVPSHAAPPAQEMPVHSNLWGVAGELWSPAGRLPDFSFAGYRQGEAPLPSPPVVTNVRDFGAKGDGETDDTQAFLRAIAATEKGALLVPAGRYKITDFLTIDKSNFVLRGEGRDKSILVCPKPLEEIRPLSSRTTEGRSTSGYSWSGGIVRVSGKLIGAPLGKLKTRAERGTQVIELETPAPALKAGQSILISQRDTAEKTLINHLYAGQPGNTDAINATSIRTSFVSRVTRVDGGQITLARPLLTDIDSRWNAEASVFETSVHDVGIENLTWEFPGTPYEGHFTEVGYNPLAFSNVANCWGRNLRFINADSGPFLGSRFITLENLTYEATRRPDKSGNTGHHGITAGTDNLIRDFDIGTRFIHDISVESSSGSVVMDGKGVDLSLDNHKRYPHANLFTNIDIGIGLAHVCFGRRQRSGKARRRVDHVLEYPLAKTAELAQPGIRPGFDVACRCCFP
jgi:hypothetical protein